MTTVISGLFTGELETKTSVANVLATTFSVANSSVVIMRMFSNNS